MTLQSIFDAQRALQINSYGQDPASLSQDDKIQFIKDMVLAAEDELHEVLGEVGWKPWATSRHINEEAYKGELVDTFHFFINLCLVVGMTAEELETRYMAKRQRNAERQAEGYDGVEGKCPGCKRAYDDSAVMCIPEDDLEGVVGYCDAKALPVYKGKIIP